MHQKFASLKRIKKINWEERGKEEWTINIDEGFNTGISEEVIPWIKKNLSNALVTGTENKT